MPEVSETLHLLNLSSIHLDLNLWRFSLFADDHHYCFLGVHFHVVLPSCFIDCVHNLLQLFYTLCQQHSIISIPQIVYTAASNADSFVVRYCSKNVLCIQIEEARWLYIYKQFFVRHSSEYETSDSDQKDFTRDMMNNASIWHVIQVIRRIIHHIRCTRIWLYISGHLSVAMRRSIL